MTTTLLGAHLFNFLHDRVLWEGCEVLSNELRWVEYRLPAAASLIVPYEQIVLIRQQERLFCRDLEYERKLIRTEIRMGFTKKFLQIFVVEIFFKAGVSRSKNDRLHTTQHRNWGPVFRIRICYYADPDPDPYFSPFGSKSKCLYLVLAF